MCACAHGWVRGEEDLLLFVQRRNQPKIWKCLAPNHPMEKEPCRRQLPPPFVNVGACVCWNAGGIKVQTTTTTVSTVTTTTANTTAGWCWAFRLSDGRAGCAIRGAWPKKNISDLKTWCRPSPPNHAFQRYIKRNQQFDWLTHISRYLTYWLCCLRCIFWFNRVPYFIYENKQVQVIEEAIKYIDSLHEALFQRLRAQELATDAVSSEYLFELSAPFIK